MTRRLQSCRGGRRVPDTHGVHKREGKGRSGVGIHYGIHYDRGRNSLPLVTTRKGRGTDTVVRNRVKVWVNEFSHKKKECKTQCEGRKASTSPSPDTRRKVEGWVGGSLRSFLFVVGPHGYAVVTGCRGGSPRLLCGSGRGRTPWVWGGRDRRHD